MGIIVMLVLVVIISFYLYKNFSSQRYGIEALKGGKHLFDGMTKAEILKWFLNSTPWNRINKNFIEVIVAHFYKNPMLDLFVLDIMKRPENIELINNIENHLEFKKASGKKNVENMIFLNLLYKLYCKKAIVIINMLSKMYHSKDKNEVHFKESLAAVYTEVMDYLDIASMIYPSTIQPHILKVRLLYQAELYEKAALAVNEGAILCENKFMNAKKDQFLKWDEESKTFDYIGYVYGTDVKEVTPIVGHRLLTEFLINWEKLC